MEDLVRTKRIVNLRHKGYSVITIAEEEKVSTDFVLSILGISEDNSSVAYARVHTGNDLDFTGKFREISTMKWVNREQAA